MKVAPVKFIDGVDFLVKTIHENHFSRCQDLYFASTSDMAESPHSPEFVILIIQPFSGHGALIDAIASPSSLGFQANEILL